MTPQLPLRDQEAENWEFFLSLPDVDPKLIRRNTIKGPSSSQPLSSSRAPAPGAVRRRT